MMADGGLELLVTTEIRLAEQLAAATAEAAAMLEAARLAVATDEAGYAMDLEAASALLAARSEEGRQLEISRIRAAAERTVQRFERLSGASGEALAQRAVARVLAAWDTEAPA